jgi:hypothetical protein
MGESSDGFTGIMLEGAPVCEILPKPPGAGGVVQGDEVVPEFDTVVGLEEVVARAAK